MTDVNKQDKDDKLVYSIRCTTVKDVMDDKQGIAWLISKVINGIKDWLAKRKRK